ncbi:MAG: CotH kinase family protein, partial [Firmicutes bacterium]|nr:CotH kinase family protein [Bacillota bacterium]
EAEEPDGVFDGVDSVTVTLSAPGTIYYTTDGTMPNAASPIYTEPLKLTRTTVVRAINWETGAMPSRIRTLSYIINEGHSLPVVSLVSNDKLTFNGMYYTGSKEIETPGNLAFYSEDGSFNIPCGVKMQGGTSLELPKKNMSLRFRGSYGQEKLNYDLFGGGVTSFTNLLLRSGQDYYTTVFRNELCLNLALSASDSLVTQRSRYCILYVDGKYYGIYALMEKSNEQMYADLMGFSRESVTTVEADNTLATDLNQDVFEYALTHDMTDADNYAHFCQQLDINSMIDWFLLEGYCANSDLTYGNLRYVHSTEGDGKWRFMFYDLDAAFREPGNNFYNLFAESQLYSKQICTVLVRLLKNEDFKDQMLTRAGELLNGPLTNDKVLAEIDRLAAQVEPEVERDYVRYALTYHDWARHVQQLRSFIQENDWRQHNIDTLCAIFKLDEQQRIHYFGK